MQIEQSRVQAAPDTRTADSSAAAAGARTLFTALTDTLRSQNAPDELLHVAATVAWALAPSAVARTALVDAGVVQALWELVRRLALVAVQGAGSGRAAERGKTVAGSEWGIEGRGAGNTGAAPAAMDDEAMYAATESAEELQAERASHGTLEATLAALAILMVDPAARAALTDPALCRKEPWLQALFDLASVHLPGDGTAEALADDRSEAGSSFVDSDGGADSQDSMDVDHVDVACADAEARRASDARAEPQAAAQAPPADLSLALACTGPPDEPPADAAPSSGSADQEAEHAVSESLVRYESNESESVTASAALFPETASHRHRHLAAAVLATALRRDAGARALCVASGALPLLLQLLAPRSRDVQLHGAAALAAFASADEALDAAALQRFAAAADTSALVVTLCEQLEAVDGKLATGTTHLTEAGDVEVDMHDLGQMLGAALQHAMAAAVSQPSWEAGAEVVTCLVRLADTCVRAGAPRNDTLAAASASLALVCGSNHAEALLLNMAPLPLASLGDDFAVPLGCDTQDGSTTLLALVCRTLTHVMGAGVYAVGCWDALLPSAIDPRDPHRPVPLPQPPVERPPVHVTDAPHACQRNAAAALVALALHRDQHALPDSSEAEYRGPFRETLLEMGLLPHLLALADASWPDASARESMRGIATAGFMALVATGRELPRCHLQELVAYSAKRVQAGDVRAAEFQMMSATLWLATRNPVNCAYLHTRTAAESVAAELAKLGVAHLLCHRTPGDPVALEEVATSQPRVEALASSHFAWLLGMGGASFAKGLDTAVLLLWTLLQRGAHSAASASDSASVYGRTNTVWWELPVRRRCVLALDQPVHLSAIARFILRWQRSCIRSVRIKAAVAC